MAKKLTSSKAKKILKDGQAHGKPLTPKQKRYMGWVAGGKAQDGDTLKPKKFIENYIKSPKYRERLISSGYENVDNEILNRLNNIKDIKTFEQYGNPSLAEQLKFKSSGKPYTTVGSVFLPGDNSIIVDTKQAEQFGVSPSAIEAHEFGHAELRPDVYTNRYENVRMRDTRLNMFDNLNLKHKLKPDSSRDLHDSLPDENKSDLNALRFLLKQEGIYDAGYEDFNKEHLDKLKDSYIKTRLLKNYSEDDLIWLMNNIAKNNSNSDKVIVANGGQLKKSNQLRTFTNGWVDKYL